MFLSRPQHVLRNHQRIERRGHGGFGRRRHTNLDGGRRQSGGNFSGVIKNSAGSLALTKTGTNSLTLSGTKTYSGATIISAGTLDLTGSLSNSPVTVSGSAVLSQAASGSIGGAVALTHSTSSDTSTLAGANTYTGGTTNSGVNGIVAVNNANALGTGPFTFAGGRRLVVAAGIALGRR